MGKRIAVGLLIGAAAGVLDVIPMIPQHLTWGTNVSALLLWVVIGFMLATTDLHLSPVLKGVVIAFLCLLPSVSIIGWKSPSSLIPVFVITLILGALVGFVFSRAVKE
jgi:hypothetical protein